MRTRGEIHENDLAIGEWDALGHGLRRPRERSGVLVEPSDELLRSLYLAERPTTAPLAEPPASPHVVDATLLGRARVVRAMRETTAEEERGHAGNSSNTDELRTSAGGGRRRTALKLVRYCPRRRARSLIEASTPAYTLSWSRPLATVRARIRGSQSLALAAAPRQLKGRGELQDWRRVTSFASSEVGTPTAGFEPAMIRPALSLPAE